MSTRKDLDQLIKDSLITYENPSVSLNSKLKIKLYDARHSRVSLWYVPMLLNFLVFILLNMMAQLLVQQIIILKAFHIMSVYLISSGIILTLIGVKYANLKDSLTLERKGLK